MFTNYRYKLWCHVHCKKHDLTQIGLWSHDAVTREQIKAIESSYLGYCYAYLAALKLCSFFSLFHAFSCILRFSQGLRLRQVDMLQDGITGSSASLTKMTRYICDVCVAAMEKFRRRTGQCIGGRRQFIVIDESNFRYKRKASAIIVIITITRHSIVYNWII